MILVKNMNESNKKRTIHIVCIVNQKGGVGKTTTTINLATAIASVGKKVLIVDFDAQGNASTGLGVPLEQRSRSSYDLIVTGAKFSEVVVETKIPNLSIIPASNDLSSTDIDLKDDQDRALKFKGIVDKDDYVALNFDYIFVDCPPALNLLTVNALVASHSVLVPLQAEFFALEGLSQLFLTVRKIRSSLNPSLKIQGVLLTMYDKRNNLSLQIEEDVRENLSDLVYETVIPRNIRLSEAPSFSLPAIIYDSKCSGSIAYQKLAAEFLEREEYS